MSKPDDIPQDVWDDAAPFYAAYVEGPELTQTIIARAILAERLRISRRISDLSDRVGSIEVEAMRGENLAVTLCTHFDDGGDVEDDTGWSEAATEGYQQTIDAIRAHYSVAAGER